MNGSMCGKVSFNIHVAMEYNLHEESGEFIISFPSSETSANSFG